MGKKGIFICLIGIDGSGKTTHAKALVGELEAQGIKSRYVWNRYEPILIRPLMVAVKMLLFRRKNINSKYMDYSIAKKRLFQNHLLAMVWHYLVLFDYLPQILLKIKIPLVHGEIIICDRYIYDTIVDRVVEFDYSTKEIKKILESRFLSLFPKPDQIFLLDVPEKIAIQRKNDIISINYLVERRRAYLNIREVHKITMLDNSGDFVEANNVIKEKAIHYIAGRGGLVG